MRDLAAEFGNISQSSSCRSRAGATSARPQTMLGYQQEHPRDATTSYVRFDAGNLPVASSAPSGRQSASTVVLTSKAQGHLGGNYLTAQLVAPTGANAPLTVTVTGNAISVNVASGAAVTRPTRTARRHDLSGHQHGDPGHRGDQRQRGRGRARPAPPSTARHTGDGVVAPSVRSPLSDLLRAPANVPRGPQSTSDAPHRQAARRLQGRRVPLLPGARPRDRDLAASASRPRSGCCATTGPIPRPRRSSTTSTSSSSRRSTATAATHSLYDSNRSART